MDRERNRIRPGAPSEISNLSMSTMESFISNNRIVVLTLFSCYRLVHF
jgi:hypothetical protein